MLVTVIKANGIILQRAWGEPTPDEIREMLGTKGEVKHLAVQWMVVKGSTPEGVLLGSEHRSMYVSADVSFDSVEEVAPNNIASLLFGGSLFGDVVLLDRIGRAFR